MSAMRRAPASGSDRSRRRRDRRTDVAKLVEGAGREGEVRAGRLGVLVGPARLAFGGLALDHGAKERPGGRERERLEAALEVDVAHPFVRLSSPRPGRTAPR